MTKYCSECGSSNKDDASFCEKCGSSLKENIRSDFNNNNKLNEDYEKSSRNKNIVIVALIVIIVAVSVGFATYAVMSNNNQGVSVADNLSHDQTHQQQVTQKSSSPTWHLIKTAHGGPNENSIDSQSITVNTNGKVKVVISGMPIENYVNNYANGNIQGSASGNVGLSWGATDDTVLQSDSFEGGNGGTVTINLNYFNMDYWDLEVYDYY